MLTDHLIFCNRNHPPFRLYWTTTDNLNLKIKLYKHNLPLLIPSTYKTSQSKRMKINKMDFFICIKHLLNPLQIQQGQVLETIDLYCLRFVFQQIAFELKRCNYFTRSGSHLLQTNVDTVYHTPLDSRRVSNFDFISRILQVSPLYKPNRFQPGRRLTFFFFLLFLKDSILTMRLVLFLKRNFFHFHFRLHFELRILNHLFLWFIQSGLLYSSPKEPSTFSMNHQSSILYQAIEFAALDRVWSYLH